MPDASSALAVIILNHETGKPTLDCLASLAPEVDDRVSALVVDNASTDGSPESIEAAIEENGWTWATVVRSPTNAGFAGGSNLGIRHTKADAYVLLSSDTIVLPGAIRALRNAMVARPDAGIIGAGLLDANGEPDRSYFRNVAPASEFLRMARTKILSRIASKFDVRLPTKKEPFEADWIGFACALVRREVVEQIGLLDDGYFMDFEDIDYCRRASRAGWKILVWPDAKVVHQQAGSSEVTGRDRESRRAPRHYYDSRARYFTTYYGPQGLWLANGYWTLGWAVARARQALESRPPTRREREALDIWMSALRPRPGQGTPPPVASHDDPYPIGDRNENPSGVSLLQLLVEDLETHDLDPLEPGFWAVAVHRLGNARMDVRQKAFRAPLTLAYHTAFTAVNWLWGINLPYTARLGRRVRIWHHGGMMLGARAIGDDVHLRHNTTMGLLVRHEREKKPIIGNRVDVGTGACVLGAVTVGDDAVIGANTVVTRDVQPGMAVMGVPARPASLKIPPKNQEGSSK